MRGLVRLEAWRTWIESTLPRRRNGAVHSLLSRRKEQTEEQGDQLLVDLRARTFVLPSTAAVVDRGVALEGSSDDIAGTRRPQGAGWDIGAYEYVKPGATPR